MKPEKKQEYAKDFDELFAEFEQEVRELIHEKNQKQKKLHKIVFSRLWSFLTSIFKKS